MKTKKKEALIRENYLNNSTFIADLTIKVEKYLSWFSYKILDIDDVYVYRGRIIFYVQVDYSFPPITVQYSIKKSTLRIVLNENHIDEIN